MATNTELTQFRDRVYRNLPGRGDAAMDLIDALSSNLTARSVVELSLNPAFRRKWPSVTRTIDRFRAASSPRLAWAERGSLESTLRRAVHGLLDEPARGHWLMSVDATPYERRHAECLEDRSWVHQSAGNGGTPVTIGHAYSIVVGVPERARRGEPAWVLPISTRRIPTTKTPASVAAEQVFAICDDPELAWYEQVIVVAADSGYCCLPFLGPLADFAHVVTLTRTRSNRVFAHPPPAGSRMYFGERFDLADDTTWGEPAETIQYCRFSRGGKRIEVSVQRWSGLLMRGTRDWPMHRRPFDLLRVVLADEHGVRLRPRPMWLVLMGQRREEISSHDAVEDYGRRFDQEHYHRFIRQRLLFDAYQTSVTEHEENWTMLGSLAYAQLFAARYDAPAIARPWESPRDYASSGPLSPTMVQRAFAGLLRQLGTPARAPKPRNLATGRLPGASPGHRSRHAVVRKAKPGSARARAPDPRAA
jgi:hypothetical protein